MGRGCGEWEHLARGDVKAVHPVDSASLQAVLVVASGPEGGVSAVRRVGRACELRRWRASGGKKLSPARCMFREAQDGRGTLSGSRAVLAALSSPHSRIVLGCRVREQDPRSGRVHEALAACAATKASRAGKIEAPDPMGSRSGPSDVRVGDR